MELNAQIRKYRAALGLSQEELGERVYVTRQTVSNWETGKSYPDIHSLLLLSSLFQVSLDELIKGDVETMKELVNACDIAHFKRVNRIFDVHFIVMLLLAPFLILWNNWYSWGLAGVLFALAIFWGIKVEKLKMKYDVQTYREIVAFLDGKRLDELQKAAEVGKRPYQKAVLILLCALLGALVSAAAAYLLHHLR